jgi:hypothetical protein
MYNTGQPYYGGLVSLFEKVKAEVEKEKSERKRIEDPKWFARFVFSFL